MLGQRHEVARLQSNFYQNQYHKILKWLMVCSLIIIALILAIIYFILFQPPRQYFATTSSGQIIPMVIKQS